MSDDPKLYPDPKPEREAVVIRGACGAVFGLAAAGYIWMRSGGLGPLASVTLFVVVVAGSAWGSIRHGDAFWYAVLRRRP